MTTTTKPARRETIAITSQRTDTKSGALTSVLVEYFGQEEYLAIADMPAAIVNELLVYGLKQKLADKIANKSGHTDTEKAKLIGDTIDGFRAGIWATRATSTRKLSADDYLLIGLKAKYPSRPEERLIAYIASLDDASKKKVAGVPEIAAAITLAKAANKRVTSDREADDLLSGLDDDSDSSDD